MVKGYVKNPAYASSAFPARHGFGTANDLLSLPHVLGRLPKLGGGTQESVVWRKMSGSDLPAGLISQQLHDRMERTDHGLVMWVQLRARQPVVDPHDGVV